MAVARGATGWDSLASTTPTGAFVVDTGSDRMFVCVVMSERSEGFTATDLLAGNISPTYIFSSNYDQPASTQDTQIHVFVWDEEAIALFETLNFTGWTVTNVDPTPVHDNHVFTFCTFTGVDQNTAPVFTAATADNADTLNVASSASSGDWIVAIGARSSSSRQFGGWDSLSEIFDAGNVNFRQGLADGNAGDDTTTVTGDGTTSDIHAATLVLFQETVTPPPATTVIIDGIGPLGPEGLNIVFDGELRVEITGEGFEATQAGGVVTIHDYNPEDSGASGNDEAQTVTSWSDTLIELTVIDRGAITATSCYLSIEADGGDIGYLPIVVKAPTGGDVIRRSDPTEIQPMLIGSPVSVPTYKYLFDNDVQDALTFTASGYPPGIDFDPATRTFYGVVADGAESGSPYTVTITVTDVDGNVDSDTFQWTVVAESVDPEPEPEPEVEDMASTRNMLNNVLRGLRQFSLIMPEGTTSTSDPYIEMLLQLLNEAKEEAEEVGWAWYGLRDTVTITTEANVATYSIHTDAAADVDTNARSRLMYETVSCNGSTVSFRNSDRSKPLMFDVAGSFVNRLQDIPLERMERLHLTDSDETGPPQYFSVYARDGTLNIKFWPTPDEARTIKGRFYIPQDELEKDALTVAIRIPERPIWTRALFKANEERGEEQGRPGASLDKAATDALAVAVANEQHDADITVILDN